MGLKDIYNAEPENTLKLWKTKQGQLGFDSFPEVAINNMIYRGNFEGDEIMDSFCRSLESPPQYCIDGVIPVVEPVPVSTSSNHLAIILAVTIGLVILIVILVVVLYPRFVKKEITSDMTGKVGELVAHYANKVSKQKIRQKEKFIEAHDEEL